MHPSGFIRHQFPRVHPSGFLDHQAPEPRRHRGPIIQGLDSDYETEYTTEERKENPRKRSRSNDEPSVEHPDDETEGNACLLLQHYVLFLYLSKEQLGFAYSAHL